MTKKEKKISFNNEIRKYKSNLKSTMEIIEKGNLYNNPLYKEAIRICKDMIGFYKQELRQLNK